MAPAPRGAGDGRAERLKARLRDNLLRRKERGRAPATDALAPQPGGRAGQGDAAERTTDTPDDQD